MSIVEIQGGTTERRTVVRNILFSRKPFIVLGAVFVVLLFCLQGSDLPAEKKESQQKENVNTNWTNCSRSRIPLEIDMSVQNVIENQGGAQAKGGLVEMVVSFKPLLDTEDFSWHLELPEGVKVNSGPDSWTGLVARDETASFVMTLSVPDGKEYYIDAVGEYAATTGAQVRKARSLKVDLGEPEPPANPSFIRVDETGRRVVSYRGNVIGGGQ